MTYIQPDGASSEVEASRGDSVMSAAIAAGVPGIVADCRGGLTCATCHVFVDEEWLERVGEKEPEEEEMLELTAVPATECSRLSCQIVLVDELDGLVVTVPEEQE
ncbi:2Fe-2S iron-sulfur cluster-binding protein [Microbacterium sp. No. 7]|uniref:2Fe-2S iron-sulfur cluster-binding protein n=1 Tax=Microbacterium sp. No. 7 TaxID=1714373 RepID=UPI001E3CA67E|nr:2Fe-2S iron-sulfur cluster-binding protein [Microbacterium sp. No. 7]